MLAFEVRRKLRTPRSGIQIFSTTRANLGSNAVEFLVQVSASVGKGQVRPQKTRGTRGDYMSFDALRKVQSLEPPELRFTMPCQQKRSFTGSNFLGFFFTIHTVIVC